MDYGLWIIIAGLTLRPVIAGLTRNPLIIDYSFSGDPASSAG